MTFRLPYSLGCPVFNSAAWLGKVYRSDARKSQWLRQYSEAFDTVEGNSTFYGMPSHDVVDRWCDETAAGFRFVLKFPRKITHERELADCEAETATFLSLLEILQRRDRLGPSLLQLGPHFSGDRLGRLAKYLALLPREFPYAVEVRHGDFFDQNSVERDFEALLTAYRIDRVTMDTRPLYSQPPSDEIEAESQRRKPRSPIRKTVTGEQPMLRIVGRNRVEDATPWIKEWAPTIAKWIRDGQHPYIFTHAPDDAFAPDLARLFHQELCSEIDLPPLPAWPGELERQQAARQKSLF